MNAKITTTPDLNSVLSDNSSEKLARSASNTITAVLATPHAQIWSQDSPGVEGVAELFDRFGASLIAGDFNDDGVDDLAIGSPGESIGSVSDAGAINVLLGSSSGLSASGDQIWHQDSPGILDQSESNIGILLDLTGDQFGNSLASGDFNGGGRNDIAIGVPGENIGTTDDAGAANVLYGSVGGFSTTGNQFLHQNTSIDGVAEREDSFGGSLISGDFNGDGADDLAIGVPGENIGAIDSAGAVNILYGSFIFGLSLTSSQIFHQNTPNIEGISVADDNFGTSLTSGDFNGDGRDDLAIGVPNDAAGAVSAGAVNVLHGSNTGLTSVGDQIWHLNRSNVIGTSAIGDDYGSALASGDFNGDGRDDLATGIAGKTINAQSSAGAVSILYGSGTGLTATGNQLFSQNSFNVANSAESFDHFGSSLGVGDFNGDGRDDLAIGVPGEDTDGAVNILYGSNAGLTGTGSQFFTYVGLGGTPSVNGNPDFFENARFGESLTSGDFNNDGFDDLAIGAPGADLVVGQAFVLYGSAAGLIS